jgi:hypothetical protein
MNVNNIRPSSIPAGGAAPVRKSGKGSAAVGAKGHKTKPAQPAMGSSSISASANKVLNREEKAYFEKLIQLPEGRLYAESGYAQPGGQKKESLGKIIDRMV